MTALVFLDLGLILLVTLRLTRLVTTDDLGAWYLQTPAADWAARKPTPAGGSKYRLARSNLVTGLECPFCVGFWVGALVLLSYGLASSWTLGDASSWWRWLAAPFALNWLAGHLAAWLD